MKAEDLVPKIGVTGAEMLRGVVSDINSCARDEKIYISLTPVIRNGVSSVPVSFAPFRNPNNLYKTQFIYNLIRSICITINSHIMDSARAVRGVSCWSAWGYCVLPALRLSQTLLVRMRAGNEQVPSYGITFPWSMCACSIDIILVQS